MLGVDLILQRMRVPKSEVDRKPLERARLLTGLTQFRIRLGRIASANPPKNGIQNRTSVLTELASPETATCDLYRDTLSSPVSILGACMRVLPWMYRC